MAGERKPAAGGVELSLGLSIGRSSQTSQNLHQTSVMGPSVRPPIPRNYARDPRDPQWRRQYSAIRRREAKRKHDEKLQMKEAFRGKSPFVPNEFPSPNASLSPTTSPTTVLNPTPISIRRPEPTPTTVLNPTPISIHNLNPEQIPVPNPNPAPAFPVVQVPVQYAYQPTQYMAPYPNNGYGLPLVMPLWIPPVAPVPMVDNAVNQVEGNGLPPLPSQIVQPQPVPFQPVLQPNPAPPAKPSGSSNVGYDPEIARKGVAIPKVPSWQSSSNVSDFHNGSYKVIKTLGAAGGSNSDSSDTKTDPSYNLPNRLHLQAPQPGIPRCQSDNGIPCHQIPSSSCTAKGKMVFNGGLSSLNSISRPNKLVPRPSIKKLEGAPSVNKLMPQSAENLDGEASEEKMPFVAARGDGPLGKTVTGFLYRYTRGQVSIMCVCHGQSFTPAEFLTHAGCSDTSQPLRRIVIVPTAG